MVIIYIVMEQVERNPVFGQLEWTILNYHGNDWEKKNTCLITCDSTWYYFRISNKNYDFWITLNVAYTVILWYCTEGYTFTWNWKQLIN
jgi:hypothetical protein